MYKIKQNISSVNTNSAKKRKCDKMQECSPETMRVESDNSYIGDIDTPEISSKHGMLKVDQSIDSITEDYYTDSFYNYPSQSVTSDIVTPETQIIEVEPSSVNSYSASRAELLDTATLDCDMDVIEPLTSYTVLPTGVDSINYHTAVNSPVPTINTAAMVSALTPSVIPPIQNDNAESQVEDSNAIYCQCCSAIMSVNHTCPNENDTPSLPPPPDPDPLKMNPTCDTSIDAEVSSPNVKDPELLRILCSVIGKFKR